MTSELQFIDTHAHLDGEEFRVDADDVVARAKAAGVRCVFVPAIDLKSVDSVLRFCSQYPGFAYPMIGLHPEEVKADWREQLSAIKEYLTPDHPFLAIGEVGLDYYWSREFEQEQIEAFEEQVRWAIEYNLPLMIHCRKGQNELMHVLRRYESQLTRGGVFHCFTGNEKEAKDYLSFPRFLLGIGGVLTFKKSHLPEVLPSTVPISRIVLETDSPYMAPVPMRGKRNESAFVRHVLQRLAECYGVSVETIAETTNANVRRVFGI